MRKSVTPAHLLPGFALRILLIACLGLILSAALWTALVRVGWALPDLAPASQHGALMLSGFLGTLISLERAVALKRRWTYLVPALSAAGAILLLLGLPPALGRGLIVLAGLGLIAVFALIYHLHPSLDTAAMGLGALLWAVGSVVWWANQPVSHAVPWWAGFLVLTIAGERLELARVTRPTYRARIAFGAAVGLLALGLLVSVFAFESGVRIAGVGLVVLALWLLRFDIARRTIRRAGLTRYIAACLLPGYAWMLLGGSLWIVQAQSFVGGPAYDAMLHTLFLGFVFSMIFGHAPIILPAVLGVPVAYRPTFYTHLALLHASLALRVAGDLLLLSPLQKWGGLLNVVAVLLFVANTALAARSALRVSH